MTPRVHHRNETSSKVLGEALRAARRGAGMSQTDAAEALGTTQTTISRWEAGVRTPPANLYTAFVAVFDTSLDHLIPNDHDALSDLARARGGDE